MFEKILFPTDFSEVSLHTLYNCIPTFSKMGAEEIVIIHVLGRAVSIQVEREKAVKRLEEVTSELEDKGVNARYVVEPLGSIGKNSAEVVCKRAYAQGFDLVVTPTRGRNVFMETLIGSVARDMIRICGVPVLLLRHQWDEEREELKPKIDYNQIFDRPLVALDFSTCSERVLDVVKKVEDVIKEAILYHVVDYGRSEDLNDNIKEAEYTLEKYARTLSISTKKEIGRGGASETIMSAAQDTEASMIVTSKSGGGMLHEVIVGSTTNSLVRKFSQPVLVVPCHDS